MGNQTNPKPFLLVGKKTIEFVRPSKHTPFQNLSLSSLDNNAFNEIMCVMIFVYEANKDDDPVALLRKALSDLLVYYYPLSGELMKRKSDGKFQIVFNEEGGFPFAVATANRDLLSLKYLDNISDEAAMQLVHEIDLNYQSGIGRHPFSLQVTRFACGGFTIGIAATHVICDGTGMATFFKALTELAGGKSEPSVKPVWQRERLVQQIDNKPANVPCAGQEALMATSPYYKPGTVMVTETVNIKAETIKKLKESLVSKEMSFTTFEVLCSYIWKSTSRALKLNLEGITVLGITIRIRHVVDPPLPEGYYGNSFLDVYIDSTARELHESSLSDVAKLVRIAKETALDKSYVEEELRNTERMMKEDVKLNLVTDGVLLMTDVRNTGVFRSTDFGWNEPLNILNRLPQEKPTNQGIIMRPSKLDPSMEGGVKIVMTLPRDAMLNLNKEMDGICMPGPSIMQIKSML